MIYLDKIKYFENEIQRQTQRIERIQVQINKFFAQNKDSEVMKVYIREKERMQVLCKKRIDKYKREIHFLKQLQNA